MHKNVNNFMHSSLPMLIVTGLLIVRLEADSSMPLDLSGRLEPMVDSYLIEKSNGGVSMRLHTPIDRGRVMAFDQPWEGAFSGYATLIDDDGQFHLYYRGLPSAGQDGSTAEVTCYATSDDGLVWRKPELNLFPLEGYPTNNVVLAHQAPFSHNFSPFLDRNPEPGLYRFKALAGIASSGLKAFGSTDGMVWTPLGDEPVFKPDGWVLDSQNVSFWSVSEGKYLCYYRSSVNGVRSIARASSRDFIHWQAEGQMVFSDTGTIVPSHHLYTSQTHPYFRAPHVYLATPARFFPGRQVLSEAEAREVQVHPKYYNDTSDAGLMTSRGGLVYDRTHMEALLRPGMGPGNWVSRSNYPVLGIVQTSDTTMSLYTNQDYGQPTAHLHRYEFRLDGLSSWHAGNQPGWLLTKPFKANAQGVFFNYWTSASGYLKVECLDSDLEPINGYGADEATELIGNHINRLYRWQDGGQLRLPADGIIRLRIHLRDSDLYALRFGPLE